MQEKLQNWLGTSTQKMTVHYTMLSLKYIKCTHLNTIKYAYEQTTRDTYTQSRYTTKALHGKRIKIVQNRKNIDKVRT